MSDPSVRPTVEGIILATLNRLESKVDSGFTAVDIKLEAKADKGDLREIKGELRGLDTRLKVVEEDKRSRDDRQQAHEEHTSKFLTRRGKVWATVYAVASLFVFTFGHNISQALWH